MIKLRSIWHRFCRQPFRLFFTMTAAAAVVVPLLFVGSIYAVVPVVEPLQFHLFGFLQIIAGAAYAGFLYTAMPEWTGFKGDFTLLVKLTFGIWLAAAVISFVALTPALVLMAVFWLLLFGFCLYVAIKTRNGRQNTILMLVFTLAVLTLLQLLLDDYIIWQQLLHINILAVCLVNIRVGFVLGNEALIAKNQSGEDKFKFVLNPIYNNILLLLVYALVISNFYWEDITLEAWLHLAVGCLMLAKLKDWHYVIILKQHFNLVLYLTILLIGLGYLWRGYGLFCSDAVQINMAFHLLAVGGFLLMIYQIMNIAGQRHSGVQLNYFKLCRWGIVLLVAAALMRSVVSSVEQTFWFYLFLPSMAVALAFIFYLIKFIPLFSGADDNQEMDCRHLE